MTATKPIGKLLKSIAKTFRRGTSGIEVSGGIEVEILSLFSIDENGDMSFGTSMSQEVMRQLTGAAIDAGFSLSKDVESSADGLLRVRLRMVDDEGGIKE